MDLTLLLPILSIALASAALYQLYKACEASLINLHRSFLTLNAPRPTRPKKAKALRAIKYHKQGEAIGFGSFALAVLVVGSALLQLILICL